MKIGLIPIPTEQEWRPKFYYFRPTVVRHVRDGFERRCGLCGQRSWWHAVVGRIYITAAGELLLTRDCGNIETWCPRTLLKAEAGQLGEGFHWICRYRKKCRATQWANIRSLT